MKAIRVKKKVKGSYHSVHWLTDDESTRCGIDVDTLDVVEELDVEELPATEGCRNCSRSAEPWARPKPTIVEPFGYALTATRGRISRMGPLRHTGRSGHGHRLQ